MLCHCTEVSKDFWCHTTDCVFCNVIGGGKFLSRKYSTLMKPEGSAEHHQILSSRGWGLGTRLCEIVCVLGVASFPGSPVLERKH